MRWAGLRPSLPRLSPVSALEKGQSRATGVSRDSLKREGSSRHQNPTPAPGAQKGLLAAWFGGGWAPRTDQTREQAGSWLHKHDQTRIQRSWARGHRRLLEKHPRATCSEEHDGAWVKENTKEPSVGAAAGVLLSHCGRRQSACRGARAGTTGCGKSGNLGPLASLSGAQAPAGPGGGAGPARGGRRSGLWLPWRRLPLSWEETP